AMGTRAAVVLAGRSWGTAEGAERRATLPALVLARTVGDIRRLPRIEPALVSRRRSPWVPPTSRLPALVLRRTLPKSPRTRTLPAVAWTVRFSVGGTVTV